MGRPSKLTPAVQRVIVAAIAAGNTREVSATAAGIGTQTLYAWLARGQQPGAPRAYREFREAVKKAEGAAVIGAVAIVRRAAHKNWQAAAWWLERRYPDEWGRKDRVEIEHLLRQEAARMAKELGLNEEDVVADAERIIARLS